MRIIQIKCPNCGSSIKINPDTSNLHCPYCHSEMYIDDDVAKLERKLSTMTSAYDRLIKTDIHEKVETGKIELEKRKFDNDWLNERRRSKDKAMYIFIAYLIIMVILFKSIIGDEQPNPNLIPIPFSSSEYKNEQYDVIVQRLEDAGFTNVNITKIPDLVTGFWTKDGEVKTVTINGVEKFSEYEQFDLNAKINVSYHTFPDKKIKTSIDVLKTPTFIVTVNHKIH